MQKRVVLLVDPEALVHEALARSLRGEAYEILHAYDAGEATRVLATRADVAAMIWDPCTSGADGLRVLAEARTRHPHVKTMLLTALTDVQRIDRLVRRGRAHGYVTKPWKASVLREELWNLVYGLPDLDAEAA